MRFHILGLGSIGSLVAHHLRQSLKPNHGVTLIVKNKQQGRVRDAEKIQVERSGVVSKSWGYSVEVFDNSPSRFLPDSSSTTKRTYPAIANLTQTPPDIASLIVTAKAHQTLPAIRQLQPRLTANSTIVLLQNGMGVYEELLSQVFTAPEERPHFILASNSHGAYSFEDRVIHSGLGTIELGIAPDFRGRNYEATLENTPSTDLSPQLQLSDITTPEDPEHQRYYSLQKTIASLTAIKPLGISWKPISDVQLAMRRKVVVNSVINPLTALLRCRNGDIFNTQAALDINSSVCAEAARAFAAQVKAETAGWLRDLADQGYDPSEMDAGKIPATLMKESMENEVLRVAKVTWGNKSSMLSDIEKGRPTEIDYINGYLLRLGSEYGVTLPTVSTLYNMVKMRSAIPVDQIL